MTGGVRVQKERGVPQLHVCWLQEVVQRRGDVRKVLSKRVGLCQNDVAVEGVCIVPPLLLLEHHRQISDELMSQGTQLISVLKEFRMRLCAVCSGWRLNLEPISVEELLHLQV